MSDEPEDLEPENEEEETNEPEAEEPPVFPITPLGAEMPETPAVTTGNTENRGRSFEWGLDVKINDEWYTSPLIKSPNPNFAPKEYDGATNADKGNDHPIKIGETGQLTVTIPAILDWDEDGHFQPDLQTFLDAAAPDTSAEERKVTLRYYHDPADAKPNPTMAFEFDAAITAERAQTGVAEGDEWNITAKALGPRRRITNPAITAG